MSYVDLQVNGYAGVDFNKDALTLEELRLACDRLAADGVDAVLATVITDSVPAMCARLSALVRHREADPVIARVIAGLHIEGPFLSPLEGYRGAHPLDAIRPADVDVMNQLLDAAGGLTRIVTLAPECDPRLRVTRLLASKDVVVSAGHTDADLDTLRAAIDAGLSMATHVGNGCPMRLHRHDNIIQRLLGLADRLMLTFIADGVHVPFVALRNYLALAGIDRCVIVTDAMAAAGLGPGRYTLGRWDLTIGEDLAAWAPDRAHLVGSAITMKESAARLGRVLGYGDDTLRRLTSGNARRALGGLI